MKYAARMNKANNVDSFSKAEYALNNMFFQGKPMIMEILRDLGEYMEHFGFPCDKITFDPFTGYSNQFAIICYLGSNKVLYARIKAQKNDILKVDYISTLCDEDVRKKYGHIIVDYFDMRNDIILQGWMEDVCKLSNDGTETIIVEEYIDYKKKSDFPMCGYIEDIFDRFTTLNDRLKYVNGHYYRFADKNIDTLYYLITTLYKGNYFLDNAVKRGVTID